jgi:nitroreductase / dihydropteridine reductase
MEGFDPMKFNEVLGLDALNLHATVILPVGYRSAEDSTQSYKKVRRELSDIVVRM